MKRRHHAPHRVVTCKRRGGGEGVNRVGEAPRPTPCGNLQEEGRGRGGR